MSAAGIAVGLVLSHALVGYAGFRLADRLRRTRREVIDWMGEDLDKHKMAELAEDRNVVRITGQTRAITDTPRSLPRRRSIRD